MSKFKKLFPWFIMLLGATLFGLMLMQFKSNNVQKHQSYSQQKDLYQGMPNAEGKSGGDLHSKAQTDQESDAVLSDASVSKI